jgi:hypothetical protein
MLLVLFIQLVTPGALATIRGQLIPSRLSSSLTVQDRTDDYDAVGPDVRKYIALGRGFGTYDSVKYRVLDNQYLGLLVETGFIGLGAYILVLLTVLCVAHPVIRSGDPIRGPPALAAAAGAVAFGVSNALFDVLAFPQAPYIFFFLAGLAAVSVSDFETVESPAATVENVPPGVRRRKVRAALT